MTIPRTATFAAALWLTVSLSVHGAVQSTVGADPSLTGCSPTLDPKVNFSATQFGHVYSTAGALYGVTFTTSDALSCPRQAHVPYKLEPLGC